MKIKHPDNRNVDILFASFGANKIRTKDMIEAIFPDMIEKCAFCHKPITSELAWECRESPDGIHHSKDELDECYLCGQLFIPDFYDDSCPSNQHGDGHSGKYWYVDYLDAKKRSLEENLLDLLEWLLKENWIEIDGNYHIDNDNKVHAYGNVKVKKSIFNKLPIEFDFVLGDFDCSGIGLESLAGSPEKVFGNFFCHRNKLRSLKEGPNVVLHSYHCNSNRLVSFEGIPTTIGNLLCQHNRFLALDFLPEKVYGNFVVYDNPIANRAIFTKKIIKKHCKVFGKIIIK
ncbi:MAG: hypothetical protein LBO69_05245 [Ignavibacteria bacterium]|jgi:hypothetical protein|nr:hypothetical protein [Ignavibacteria bacterium]